MTGRIKAVEGTLIGNAGEYYVTAELLKRGIIATLAPRNSPAFDILATKNGEMVRIRVKTKSEQYTDWQWMIKKDGSIFRDLYNKGDYTVLVNLADKTENMQYFILPTTKLNKWLFEVYDQWITTPGKNNRPHNPENKKRHLKYPNFAEKLNNHLNNWDLLWK